MPHSLGGARLVDLRVNESEDHFAEELVIDSKQVLLLARGLRWTGGSFPRPARTIQPAETEFGNLARQKKLRSWLLLCLFLLERG